MISVYKLDLDYFLLFLSHFRFVPVFRSPAMNKTIKIVVCFLLWCSVQVIKGHLRDLIIRNCTV